jgi:hypothetical protein
VNDKDKDRDRDQDKGRDQDRYQDQDQDRDQDQDQDQDPELDQVCGLVNDDDLARFGCIIAAIMSRFGGHGTVRESAAGLHYHVLTLAPDRWSTRSRGVLSADR